MLSGRPLILFVEGDASAALLLSEPDLLDGVGGEWVGRGDERGLGAETVLVGNIAYLSEAAFREGEAVEGGKGEVRACSV